MQIWSVEVGRGLPKHSGKTRALGQEESVWPPVQGAALNHAGC